MTCRTRSKFSSNVLAIRRNSPSCWTFPFHRKTDLTPGRMLTHAASWLSTRRCAMSRACCSVPTEVTTTRSEGAFSRFFTKDQGTGAVPLSSSARTGCEILARVAMVLPERVTLIEVGPRDGFQSEQKLIPTALKVELIEALADAGLTEIQVCSFV